MKSVILCPHCHKTGLSVTDSRPCDTNAPFRRRKYRCKNCNKRVTSFEFFEDTVNEAVGNNVKRKAMLTVEDMIDEFAMTLRNRIRRLKPHDKS